MAVVMVHSVKLLFVGSNLAILFVSFSVNHTFPFVSTPTPYGPEAVVGTLHCVRVKFWIGVTASIRVFEGDVATAVGTEATAEKSIRPMNMTTRARLLLVIMFEVDTDIYRTQTATGGRNNGVFS